MRRKRDDGLTFLLAGGARQQLVEDVEGPLVLRLADHASLLQEVGLCKQEVDDEQGPPLLSLPILAPAMYPLVSKLMRMNLPNLEELSFLTVLALPKASKMGLAFSSCCSSSPCKRAPEETSLAWAIPAPFCGKKAIAKCRPTSSKRRTTVSR